MSINRRMIMLASAAAAVAGRAVAQDVPLPTPRPGDVPVVREEATIFVYSDAAKAIKNEEIIVIHPRGGFYVAPGWTIERAMTEVWPRAGKWWEGDLAEFYAVTYRVGAAFHVTAENNAPAPTPRDDRLVGVINADGSVEFGPAFDGDEDDRERWREMGRQFVRLASLPAPVVHIPPL